MPRPAATEFAPFYASYVARVPEPEPLPALEAQPAELLTIADRIAPEDELFRYAPDKWSVRQTFGHLIDTERVMGYRAFCIARGETKALPGFSEKDYVASDDSDDRPVKALAHEFAAVRQANLWTIRRWSDEQWSALRQCQWVCCVGQSHHLHHGGTRPPSHRPPARAVRPRSVKLYDELSSWWPLMSPPAEYTEEAAFYIRALQRASGRPPKSLLELGSGGGHNASHMKQHVDEMVLVDLSEGMLAMSRTLNPELEHHQGDMRSVRLGRQFDAVFVHDAICYMATESDLRKAIETAFVHCKPGGLALFCPGLRA